MYEILHVIKHGLSPRVYKLILTMKLTTLLIFAVLFQVSAASNAQITIVNKNITLERVFKEIQKQSGYDFFYNNELIRNLSPVSLNLKNASVTTVLEASLNGLPFQYKIVENSVVITAKANAAILQNPVQQNVEITVRDENRQPIPGVTIVSKNKKAVLGMTNKDGKFMADVEEGDLLIFRFIGYAIKNTTVGKSRTIDVRLEPTDSSLGEVQISTGYQYIKPEQSTGSVTVMKNKEYDSRINTTDFLTALQNRIPGLLINNDVEFEGNSLFQIRGISTINGNKQPLIVIDGFPTELSLSSINPNEIESVTVLRDAAAATIYGVRASNGVIVIERKKAKVGKPNVAYRATLSVTPKENYERYRWDPDGSNTLIEHSKEMYKGIGASAYSFMILPTLGSLFTYPMPYAIMARNFAGVITNEEANNQFEALRQYNNAGDYADLFLRTASTQTHNIDVSGGSENATYFITARYNNSALNKIKNGGNLFELSARTNLKLSKRLSVELNTNFQEAKNFGAPVPDINTLYPYERFSDANGNPLSTYNGSKISVYYNDVIKGLGLLDNLYYPLQEINLVSDRRHTISNRVIANFKYDMGKGFRLSFGGVYETATTDARHLANENSAEVRQIINRYTDITTANGMVLHVPKGDYLRQTNSKSEGYTIRTQLDYNKQINTDHAINLISGLEVRRQAESGNATANLGYSDQTLMQRPVNYTLIQSGSYVSIYGRNNPSLVYDDLFKQAYVENRFLSGYFNAVYNYKGRYSVTGSARIDQSNLFGSDPKNRYKPSWSFGAGWNIDQEKFVQPQTWINSLKMRAALGFNGNIAKNVLPQVIASAKTNNFDYTLNSLGLLSPANSRLRWEQTFNFNLGLDYRIFKNVSGNIDYYLKKSLDILASNEVDPTRGVTSATINESTIRNGGLEVSLNADWIKRRTFNWNTGFIFSKNTSKILKVYNVNVPVNPKSWNYAVGNRTSYLEGYAVGSIFNYRYAGIDNTGKVLIYDKDGNTKNFDVDDQGLADVDYVGSSIPAYNIGLSNRVDIGDFYAFAMINYFGGFSTKIPVLNPAANRPLKGASNFWRKPGDENISDVLPALNATHANYFANTDRFIVDGTYFTLGDLTVAYSFRRANFVKKAKLSNFELRAQASNLYTFALNKHNYSVATKSFEKSYLTPTYTAALIVNF
ncbi:TonB-dependent Receptor Plug Domain protein [compost metagenome]